MDWGLVDDRERRIGLGLPRHGILDHRLVGEVLALEQRGGDVDPIAVGAAVEPEPEDLLELLGHVGIPPVQVGLLWREEV